MSDNVAIAMHLLPWRAHVLRVALATQGIFARLGGDVDNAGTESHVWVHEQDVARALKIAQQAFKL